jgi:O-antigen ligase
LVFSSAFVGLIGIGIFVNFSTQINLAFVNTDFAQRLLAATLAGREVYFANVPNIVLANPLGIASYTNPVYNRWAIDSGIISFNETALVIHNGLLATLVLYGVVGLISFVVFYVYVIGFGLNLYKTNPKTGQFLLLLCVIYLGYNATNDFSFSATQNLPMILNLFLGSIISIENKQLRRF